MHGDLRVTEADLRLRVAPELRPVPELSARAIGDALVDYEDGFEPALVAAWGEARAPVGTLSAGRMPIPRWGLGLVADPGGCLDCVLDHTVDRVGFATARPRHHFGVAYDAGADDLHTATAFAGRLPSVATRARALRAGRSAWSYGTWWAMSWRPSDQLQATLADRWLRWERGDWRIEGEGALLRGELVPVLPGVIPPPVALAGDVGAAQIAWRGLQLEVGRARGDLPVSANHAIDRIGWRGVGLQDVGWVRPAFSWERPRIELEPWLVLTTAAAPEAGGSLRLAPWRGLKLRGDAAATADGLWRLEGGIAWAY